MSSDGGDALARLGAAFLKGRPALVVYLMSGYPDRERSLAAMRVVAEAGADLIELGVPYTDPIADGPVIRDAAEAARAAAPEGRFGLAETIALAAEFNAAPGPLPPVAIMTYLNPMMRLGLPRTAALARKAGVSGFIVPDMPPEAARPWLAASRGEGDAQTGGAEHPLDTVFLAAPTSTEDRLAKIGQLSSGFVYCVSTKGITGERAELPADLAELVARVKSHTTLPVAVGFGISTPEQASAVATLADGVVVGSAAVRRQGDVEALGAFIRQLREAVG